MTATLLVSHADAIAALGGATNVARFLGVPGPTVSSWRNRDSIPGEYFTAVAAVAAKVGHGGTITVARLAELAARKLERKSASPVVAGLRPAPTAGAGPAPIAVADQPDGDGA